MQKVRSKVRVSLLILALLPGVLLAQQPKKPNGDTISNIRHEFSARQAVDYAAKNNVQVKNALLDVEHQVQVNREYTSRAYPSINGNLGTSYNPNVATTVLPNFISPSVYQVLIDKGVKDGSGNPITMPGDFGFIEAQFGTRYSATAGVSLNQILFDGQVFVGLQARSTAIDFAQRNADVTALVIRSNIYKIYYQLVASKTQVKLIDANIDLLEKNLKDTRILYSNGFAERLDIDKVSVQLTNLQTEKTRVLNNVSNGYYGLKVLMGMPVAEELILTDTLSDEKIRDGVLENPIYSYDDRLEYQSAQLGKSLQEYNVRRYKLSQYPTISLGGNYTKSAQRGKWDFLNKGNWFTIANVNLNVSVPIFNGFYTRSKIEQAKIDLQKAQNQIVNLQNTIDNEVKVARADLLAAISRMDFQKTNMNLAQEVYNQTKKKYENGLGSQTEINNAQNDLAVAQTNYVNALYDAIIAKVNYLQAIGKL